MDIALYIAELLQEHDEVCVSGLGTFLKTPVQGHFKKDTGEFYPPSSKLVFRNSFQEDTGLAEHISKVKNISLPSSSYFIEKFVGQVLNELNEKGSSRISSLGVLSGVPGSYSLQPDPDLQLGHEYYGLAPVKEYARGTFVPEPPRQQYIEPLEAGTETGYVSEEPKRSRTGLIVTGIIVLLLLGVTGIHLWKPELIRQQLDKLRSEKPASPQKAAPVLETEADSLSAADSIVTALQEQGFEVDTARDTVDVTVKARPVQPSVTYEIIAASLNRQADAEKIVKAFKSKGVDAKIILAKDKKRNNILISLASLPDKAAAQKELMRIKKEIEPGAYIYDLKNN
ncbi:MAG TPA: SPOR domain-containing protein [Sphingobacteriaceae bacterium]